MGTRKLQKAEQQQAEKVWQRELAGPGESL